MHGVQASSSIHSRRRDEISVTEQLQSLVLIASSRTTEQAAMTAAATAWQQLQQRRHDLHSARLDFQAHHTNCDHSEKVHRVNSRSGRIMAEAKAFACTIACGMHAPVILAMNECQITLHCNEAAVSCLVLSCMVGNCRV